MGHALGAGRPFDLLYVSSLVGNMLRPSVVAGIVSWLQLGDAAAAAHTVMASLPFDLPHLV